MNFKKILFVAGLAFAGCFAANAQEEVETEYVFNPHWYVQGQFGVQHTLGEIDFSDLLSPNAQVTVGYNWNAVWGARLAANLWQSRGGYRQQWDGLKEANNVYKYKWNYVAPTVDLTMNLSNAIAGFNPKRLVDVSLFAGIGANIRFKNDECIDLANGPLKNNQVERFDYLWDGSKCAFVLQWGANVDFKVNDRVSLGIEAGCNTLSDHYNSKKAGNWDWYFNALAGVKVNLGSTHSKKTRNLAPCEPTIVEKIVEKEVIKEVPVAAPAEAQEGPIRREIFFVIRGSEVAPSEMAKVLDVVSYMQRNPKAKVVVTGYADKGTGNSRINMKYSEARTKKIVDLLVQKGVDASRIISSSKGDTEQPFAENDMNRVTICVAE